MTKKDPEKVAAAYKGLIAKTTTSNKGSFTPDDYKRWLQNIISFTVPMYLGSFFLQLSMGVDWKIAATSSLAALYGPLADYFKKKQQESIYKVE